MHAGYDLLRFRLRKPRAEGSLHVRMREKRATKFPQHWAIDGARHIRLPRYLPRWNTNLNAVTITVGNGRPKNDTI
jgi:hypothetical protein